MQTERQERLVPDAPFAIRDGAGLAAGAVAIHYAVRSFAQGVHAVYLVRTLIGLAGLLVVVAIGARGKWVARLGFVWPRARYLVTAVLFGLFSVPVLDWLNAPIVRWLGPEGSPTRLMESQTTLAERIVLTGLLTPLAEEVVFRGVLVRSLATRWRPTTVVAVGAIAFALYHHSPYQVTGPLVFGAFTALLVVRSGSIVPGLVAHICTNLYVVLHRAGIPDAIWSAVSAHATEYAVAAALAAYTAVWFTLRAPPVPARQSCWPEREKPQAPP